LSVKEPHREHIWLDSTIPGIRTPHVRG
jgi:hypothetical protein